MAGATPLIIPEKSQEALILFHKQCYSMLNQQWNIRESFRQIDLSYIREADWTTEHRRAQLANRYGDSTKFQNVTVPVVMPQVESAVTYQAAVFLTGTPLFGWTSPPSHADAALQYQAIVEENSIRGGWVQQLMIFFRDCFKYNLGLVEVCWDRQVTAAIETDVNFSLKQGKPKEVIWEGNTVKRWDPYNSFWDSRYKPTEIHKNGEFIGTTELMSRVHLKKFINELPDKMVANIKGAFESGLGFANSSPGGIESYYIPNVNPDALIIKDPKRSTDWMSWAGLLERPSNEIAYKNLYEVTTLYARIIPQDFRLKVPSANTPQVWKFIIVNHQVLIYAERCTNAHGLLPVLLGQPNEDGLGYQTKSLASNAKPFQEISSALVNSAMAARRKAISDRTIYDPSRISSAHMNSDNPSAKIPLRPAGYGKNIAEAVYAFPFRDDQSAVAFQEIPQMLAMSDRVNGSNQAKQGQFVKGNKNNPEFQTIMSNANGRDQMTALSLEAQVFTPMKEIIKINTLQYQAGVEIYSPSQERVVKIDPVKLRQSFATYKLTDGLTPTEKVIHSDELVVALQVMGSSPEIGSQYNLGPTFSYLMKTRNVDLKPFEKSAEQITYEKAVASWQQVILEMVKQGVDSKQFPPQPKPQDYGYVPGQSTNQAQAPGSANLSQTQ